MTGRLTSKCMRFESVKNNGVNYIPVVVERADPAPVTGGRGGRGIALNALRLTSGAKPIRRAMSGL